MSSPAYIVNLAFDRIGERTITSLDDEGPIVAQQRVKVTSDDTPESLAARVLEVEHRFYPKVIRWFAEGRVDVVGDEVRILRKDLYREGLTK